MASVNKAVHTAIARRLIDQLGSGVAVFAGALQADQKMPAVRVGDITTSAVDGVKASRTRRVVQLTVYSNKPGPAEALDLVDGIRDALHFHKLQLDIGDAIITQVTGASTQLDVDGITYMGEAFVEVLTTP